MSGRGQLKCPFADTITDLLKNQLNSDTQCDRRVTSDPQSLSNNTIAGLQLTHPGRLFWRLTSLRCWLHPLVSGSQAGLQAGLTHTDAARPRAETES